MSDHWKALADLLGAPGLEPSTRRTRETGSQATPTTANPAVSRASEQHGDSTTTNEVPGLAVQSSAQPFTGDTASGKPESTKKKKRSNWERVANLFGLASTPEVEESPLSSADPDRSGDSSSAAAVPGDDTSSTQTVSTTRNTKNQTIDSGRKAASHSGFNVTGLFESSPEEVNPALAEMFGHSQPSYEDRWEENKRIVDDLSWEEPVENWDESPARDAPAPRSSLDEAVDPLQALEAAEDFDSPRRRSRRRRRRGRRGGRDSASDSARSEVNSSIDPQDDSNSVTEDFLAEDSLPLLDDPTESELPERRSSRRRRRRRREGFDQPSTDELGKDSDHDLPEDSQEASVETSIDDVRSEIGRQAERDETTHSRRKRRRRSRGESEGEDRSKRDGRQLDDQADDSSRTEADDLKDDDIQSKEQSVHRTSRNIPTWDETLSVMIAANLENHRRNENRGSRGGARPKGRR